MGRPLHSKRRRRRREVRVTAGGCQAQNAVGTARRLAHDLEEHGQGAGPHAGGRAVDLPEEGDSVAARSRVVKRGSSNPARSRTGADSPSTTAAAPAATEVRAIRARLAPSGTTAAATSAATRVLGESSSAATGPATNAHAAAAATAATSTTGATSNLRYAVVHAAFVRATSDEEPWTRQGHPSLRERDRDQRPRCVAFDRANLLFVRGGASCIFMLPARSPQAVRVVSGLERGRHEEQRALAPASEDDDHG
mmetsp:Transcript_65083/g.135658  ORF Transcript_65083/g.135658 Transcript_65083/m.135658 type:complete len:252 (+) Transcript_65083:276-1031(+)